MYNKYQDLHDQSVSIRNSVDKRSQSLFIRGPAAFNIRSRPVIGLNKFTMQGVAERPAVRTQELESLVERFEKFDPLKRIEKE